MSGARWQESLRYLFAPRSIALVGATERDALRRGVLENLQRLEFRGHVYPVNPNYVEVSGHRCYPSLMDVPEAPESVILAVGHDQVGRAFEEALRVGTRSIVVFSGGFSDQGEFGSNEQQRLADCAAKGGVSFLGPNCIGVVSFSNQTAQYLESVDVGYTPGSLGLISHSGSVTAALANNRAGVGWCHVASTGNEALVTAGDLLAYMIEDETCNGVLLFLEAIREPDRFFAACDRAREIGKPVIVVKVGRTTKASDAALAHTGALSTPDRLVDAAFRAHGVIRAETLEEALALGVIVQAGRIPRSNRMGVLVGSGGLIGMLHDSGTNLETPDFSPRAKAEMREYVGPLVRRRNPLDYWPTSNVDENLPRVIEIMAREDGIDGILEIEQFVQGPTRAPLSERPYGSRLVDISSQTDKFLAMLAPVHGELPSPNVIRAAADQGVALLSGYDAALRALAHFALDRRAILSEPRSLPTGHLTSLLASEGGAFSGARALDWVRHSGMNVVPFRVASTVGAVLDAATELGYPATIKLGDERVLHKTEVGGIAVGVETSKQLESIARTMLDVGNGSALVQPTVSGEHAELILGIHRDRALGAFVLVGMGGVWTEIYDDVAVRQAGHINKAEARAMLESLSGYRLLAGARGRQALCLDAVIDAILILDAVAVEFECIESLDVNPLIVTGDSAIVVDAVVSIQQ